MNALNQINRRYVCLSYSSLMRVAILGLISGQILAISKGLIFSWVTQINVRINYLSCYYYILWENFGRN